MYILNIFCTTLQKKIRNLEFNKDFLNLRLFEFTLVNI